MWHININYKYLTFLLLRHRAQNFVVQSSVNSTVVAVSKANYFFIATNVSARFVYLLSDIKLKISGY